MRRLLPALLLATPLALGGCTGAATPHRVEASVAQVFAARYADQQALLGRAVAVRALGAYATCRRTGGSGGGPGDDWACTARFIDLGRDAALPLEVTVKPDGCWAAVGPPAAEPARLGSGAAQVTNPLARFEGCLDTSA